MSSRSSPERGPLGVALLGSTGSIGTQTVDVLAAHPDAFRVIALATGSNRAVLDEQAVRLGAPIAVVGASDATLVELATRDDVDLVVIATGGIVSLRPVLAALRAGKVVATANKETLVAGGHLVMPEARRLAAARATDGAGDDPFASPLAWLRPIDSEHSALWQCLVGESVASVAALILTASGGPFLDASTEALAAVTPAQALQHPTWTMGAKITIDSATLANKGLEVIEAHWLYDVPYDAIEVVIHPQSVVHSAVRFVDGSLKAQLGTPDMHLPIQYAMTYPSRRPSPAAAPDLVATGRLDFRAPDERRFPALRIARDAGLAGPRASAALIAADDVAVARFLDGTLDFPGIPRLLEAAVARFGDGGAAPDVDELIALDTEVRARYAAGPIGGVRMTGAVQSIITIVLFIAILGILVVIHEIGHFVTARLANVRVLEFGVGFPPRAKVLRNKGETLYTLNWLPIGGFVKLEGEDGDNAADPRAFSSQSWLTKMLILVAGVVMNVLLAFVIFTGIAMSGDPTIGIRIGEVQADSPAAAAGLASGDAVVSINGQYYGAFGGESVLGALRGYAGETVELGVQHPDGTTETITVTLRDAAAVAAGQGALGVTGLQPMTTTETIRYTLPEAIGIGVERTVNALGLIVGGLGALVESIVSDPTQAPPVAGPVGIATQIGDVFWQLGPTITLYVAGVLSANLAVVNILPFPPLDGGRMLMITLKRLFGARISLRAEQLTYMVGFVFLFAFLIWVTGFDIIRGLTSGS